MDISVVMTTYNGEQYVLRQLESLLQQTRKPEEVLIFDDRSTDNTVRVIETFINEHGLDSWQCIVNEENKGWMRNFTDGINAAKGNYIFLSDQDDEWLPDKIEKMADVLSHNPQIQLLASNFTLEYEEGAVRINYKKAYEPYGKHTLEKVELNGETFEPLRPGCAYAFRREILDQYNKIWQNGYPHDRILWDIALLNQTLYIYNQPLMIQVRHAGNNTPMNAHLQSDRIDLLQYRTEVAKRLKQELDLSDSTNRWLAEYINASEKRCKNITERNMISQLAMLGKLKYYSRFIEWCIDTYIIVKA